MMPMMRRVVVEPASPSEKWRGHDGTFVPGACSMRRSAAALVCAVPLRLNPKMPQDIIYPALAMNVLQLLRH